MKKLMAVQEVEGEGMEGLLGEKVLIFCMNYIYAGTLAGVNKTCILLEDAKVVYATGDFKAKTYTDAQALPSDKWYIQLATIESYGIGK